MDSTPTPSEKPICKHGKLSGHYWITDADITSFGSWCPGPAIATPEKCEHTLKEHFLALLDPRIGPFTGDKICQPVTVSTEPETTASEATCKCGKRIVWLPASELCAAGWYHGANGPRIPCQTVAEPVSDPTPDLRERIARVLYAQDSDAGPFFYAQEYADGVDAVLAALGEKK